MMQERRSLRDIEAALPGVSRSGISRYKRCHFGETVDLPAPRVKRAQAMESSQAGQEPDRIDTPDAYFGHLESIFFESKSAISRARQRDDLRLEVSALEKAANVLERIGKGRGWTAPDNVIDARAVTNVFSGLPLRDLLEIKALLLPSEAER
ncbi:MAG TPA: hypothetical protein VGZ02_12470 [Candidatus Baltobacteraceae bacterium]|jgi:hypothetical protein|nr:hypothetical protein [Candidatus Baltobacteraceae bacterium]